MAKLTPKEIREHINPLPRLAKGERLPEKPVYWMIWIIDDQTRKPYHSRATFKKWLTPQQACNDCFGMTATKNMLFFNLTSRSTDASKRTREIAKLWNTYVDVVSNDQD